MKTLFISTFIIFLLMSCNQKTQEKNSYLKQTILNQSMINDGRTLFENQCFMCHRKPQTLDLNKLDTVTFYHKKGLNFPNLSEQDKTKIIRYLKVFKKDTLIWE